MTCYKRKLTVWPENRFFPKITPKNSLFDKNQHHPTLEGPGGQTIDSRAISGLPLKTWGHNCSNWQCGRSMASKLSPQQADKNFYQSDTQIREKWKFFTLRPQAQKRKEILWRAIKGEKLIIHRGTNAFWAKSGCGPFLTMFCLPEIGRYRKNASCQQN